MSESDYRIGTGFNMTLETLTVLDPQPTCVKGIQATRRVNSLSGKVDDQGLFTEWEFPVVEGSAEYLALMTACGLETDLTRWVTIYTRNDLFVYVRMTALAVRPQPTWRGYFPRDTTILFTRLAAATS